MLFVSGRRWIAAALATLVVAPGCDASSTPEPRAAHAAVVASVEPSSVAEAPPSAPPEPLRVGAITFLADYDAALAESRRSGKPLLVFFTAEWCVYCDELIEESFRHPKVAALAERFVCTRVDADASRDVCEKFGVAGYPTIQFLTPAGAPLNRVTGKKAPRQIVLEMQTALQTVARRVSVPGDPIAR